VRPAQVQKKKTYKEKNIWYTLTLLHRPASTYTRCSALPRQSRRRIVRLLLLLGLFRSTVRATRSRCRLRHSLTLCLSCLSSVVAPRRSHPASTLSFLR